MFGFMGENAKKSVIFLENILNFATDWKILQSQIFIK